MQRIISIFNYKYFTRAVYYILIREDKKIKIVNVCICEFLIVTYFGKLLLFILYL